MSQRKARRFTLSPYAQLQAGQAFGILLSLIASIPILYVFATGLQTIAAGRSAVILDFYETVCQHDGTGGIVECPAIRLACEGRSPVVCEKF